MKKITIGCRGKAVQISQKGGEPQFRLITPGAARRYAEALWEAANRAEMNARKEGARPLGVMEKVMGRERP